MHDDGVAAADAAAAAAWHDFLSNRTELARKRASGWLDRLPAALAASPQDADFLAALGDLHHISGAATPGSDPALLRDALTAYDAVVALRPTAVEPLRMRAETLLRLRRYADAFATFDRLHELTLTSPRRTLEVAPFRLVHDAEAIEASGRCDGGWPERARAWRELATELAAAAGGGSSGATARTPVHRLSASQRELLGPAYGQPLPLPLPASPSPSPVRRALRERPAAEWAALQREYASTRLVVLDGLLSDECLAELQRWGRFGAHFDTMRNGYLGAFPADGTTHPLLLSLVGELCEALPAVLGPHSLALWWLFKYGEASPEGIGIHADVGAVNLNVWLTGDDARLDGGGLTVYEHVPPLHGHGASAFNHEFGSAPEEQALRAELAAAGGVRRVEYACNRAALFVSDMYHESEPFRFAPGYDSRRVNLTLIFGDRWAVEAGAEHKSAGTAPAAGGAAAVPAANDAWDVFG